MVVRIWRGQATRENAPAYYRHVTGKVFPELKGITGHKGAYLLQRETAAGVEFLAVTMWESLAAIQAFAGTEAETAVLLDFDDFARHYELTFGDCGL